MLFFFGSFFTASLFFYLLFVYMTSKEKFIVYNTSDWQAFCRFLKDIIRLISIGISLLCFNVLLSMLFESRSLLKSIQTMLGMLIPLSMFIFFLRKDMKIGKNTKEVKVGRARKRKNK